jgi:O-antigen ligase/tetratricopeptide (TPR) repeat protein
MSAAAGTTAQTEVAPALRRVIVGLVALKIAGLILAFDPHGLQSFDLPKTLYSHAFGWLIAGAIAIALVRHGPGIVPRTPLNLFVILYAAIAALSALRADVPYIALFGEHPTYLGLTFIADMVVLYLAVAISVRDREDIVTLVAPIACATICALLYGFVQAAGLDPLRWTESPGQRPFSTFGHPDHFGYAAGVMIAAAAAVIAAPRASAPLRAAAAIVVVLGLAAATIVATRGTIVGLIGAAPAIAYLRLRQGRLHVAGVAAAALVILVAAGAVFAFTPLGARTRGSVGGAPTIDRLLIYGTAIDAFFSRPILGYGPAGFAVAYPAYRLAESGPILGASRPQVDAHDWILQTAVSFGVVGLAALLALILAGTRMLIAALARAPVFVGALLAAWCAYWVEGLVSVGFVGIDWLPWLALGVAAAFTTRTVWAEPVSRPRRFAAAPIALLALILAFTGGMSFAANRAAATSEAAWKAGATDLALAAARSAVERDGGRAHYWNALGLALDQAARWPEAEAAYAEAVRRAPYRAPYWENLAWARSHQGATRAADAVSAAQRALAEDPVDPYASFTLAEMLRQLGDCDDALTHASRAFALYKDGPFFSRALARAALCATDHVRSRALLERAAPADSAEVHAALADLLLADGDRERARAHATRALQIDPAQPVAITVMKALRTP